jgi:hypothetical protein
MPDCKKCGNHFPNKIVIDGISHTISRRSFCLQCSPFGLHNTSKNPGITAETRSECKRECSECKREYKWERSKGHSLSKCNSCMSRSRHVQRKLKCIRFMGGRCMGCGYDKCPAAMAFHHIDPTTKSFHIGGSECRSWIEVVRELKKCVLLCVRCHIEVHAGVRELSAARPLEGRLVS